MKCHKCGAYIPEGHMYCDECGAEIKIVPDFEPEIENEIASTMSSIAGTFVKDENKKKREVQEKDEEIVRLREENIKLKEKLTEIDPDFVLEETFKRR